MATAEADRTEATRGSREREIVPAPTPTRNIWAQRAIRLALAALMTVLTMGLWTASPLLSLWIGSQVQGEETRLTMAAVAAVAICMLVFSFALIRALGVLSFLYDENLGRGHRVRQHLPWLRSMRGERPHEEGDEGHLRIAEVIVCVMVCIAMAAFEYWFFFKAGSPIDTRSGRR